MVIEKFIKMLKKKGFKHLRNGANHQIYEREGYQVAVPYGHTMKDRTAKRILKEIERHEKQNKEKPSKGN